MADDVIEQGGDLDCSEAEEFLAKLSPMHKLWQPDPSEWVFRGQVDATMRLVAKAYRTKDYYEEFGVERKSLDWSGHGDALLELLQRFRRELDRAGLMVPLELPNVDYGPGLNTSMSEPSPEAYPLMALAQHLGLPTPLLDWSQRAAAAAYFAVADPLAFAEPKGRIAVWALRHVVAPEFDRFEKEFVTLQTAPRASNPNLHAQSGVFTWLRGELAHETSLDELLSKLGVQFPDIGKRPWLRKLTLPRECAPRALRLLSYDGVTGATMFPGYDGVARAMREQALWDQKPDAPDWRNGRLF